MVLELMVMVMMMMIIVKMMTMPGTGGLHMEA